jgi:alkyl hydroperoxide reductase subunit AhpC
MYNSRLEEKGAQVLGISCDHVASHKAMSQAMGGLPFPELSDFHPKGQASQAYELWNSERGTSRRAVLIIDKGGVVRWRKVYSPPNLPDMDEILREVDKLGRP